MGDPKRLTQENIKLVKILLKKEPRFYYLTPSQQNKILNYAINFRGKIIDLMRSMVTEYSKPKRIV